MTNQEHLDILKQGVDSWNQWRKEHADIRPDLSEANLSHAKLIGADLRKANLSYTKLIGADLSEANLSEANLSDANLNAADLYKANLTGADLSRADLRRAYLRRAILRRAYLSRARLRRANLIKADLEEASLIGANLSHADLSGTNLSHADLRRAHLAVANFFEANLSSANLSRGNLTGAMLVGTNLKNVSLTDCSIYGISVWNIDLEGAIQDNLVITTPNEPTITVDNLKIAQFIYLLLNNAEIREVIDTIGQKGVLILGRFTPERKVVLDALREKLRSLNFLPIVFDFERPTAKDFTETIMTLAGLSCFIIADITNPKSSPLELQATVPNYMTPFVPIIQEGEQPFAMFTDLQNKYHDWVLDTLLYDTPSNLVNVLERAIVKPALERQAELLLIKAQGLRTRHIKDFL